MPIVRVSRLLGLSTLVLIAATGNSRAQNAPVSRLTSTDVINEAIDTARPVTMIVGPVGIAALVEGRRTPDPTAIWIDLPDKLSGPVTLNVLSIDGRFIGSYKLDIRPGTRRAEVIQLPTHQREKRDRLLQSFFHDGSYYVAYSAVLQPGKESQPPLLLRVAASAQGLRDEERTALLVQSEGAQTVLLQPRFVSPNGSRLGPSRPCKPIKGRETFYYDYACEVEFRELVDSVRVTRIRDDDPLPPIEVRTP